MNISPVIRDLLLHNQKAVIPGFGTFMIIQRPAQLNKVTRVLTPPAKVIRFDRNLQTDDGQLSGYLIVKLKQDKDTVLKAIDTYVQHLREAIMDKGSVQIEGLGSLTKTRSGDIEFTPEDELQKRISLFELPRINIPAPTVEKEVILVKPSAPAPAVIVKKRHLWWIPAAVLLVLLALAGIVYSTGNADELIADVKELFGKKQDKETERIVFGNRTDTDASELKDTLKEEISRELDAQVDRDKVLVFKEDQTQHEEPVTVAPPVVEERPSLSDKSFHIIAGAFLVPNNAERQKAALEKQGLKAEVLPKWGDYFLVSLGSFDDYNKAMAEMRQLNSRLDKELWVMKR